MKKILFSSFLFFTSLCYSQESKIAEPDFVGQAVLVNDDGSTEALDKSPFKIAMKAKLSLSNYMKQIITVDGCCSMVTAKPTNGLLKVIIKANENKQDPTDIIYVLKFESSKRERSVETMTLSVLKGMDQGGKINRVQFSGKKYGESSYLLNIPLPGTGEYGIILTDPSKPNTPTTFASTFNVK
jgi:hypothetical protein